MGRSNFIILGAVVLAPLILGIESYALYRAHHRRARTTVSTGSTELTAPPGLDAPVEQTPPASPSAERPLPPPPLPAPAAPAVGDPPPETETVSDVQADPTVERRRQATLQRRGEVVQAADEQERKAERRVRNQVRAEQVRGR